MDYIKIQNRQLVFLFLLILSAFTGYAQKGGAEKLVDNLYNLDDQKASKNAHYMIMTDKNCYNCFRELLDALRKEEPRKNVNLIVVTYNNPTTLFSIEAKHKEELKNINNVYFLFIEECQNKKIKIMSLLQQPSPQLIYSTDTGFKLLNYSQTMKLIK
ncbi:MAG: hypothetical protein R2800_00930 [Flavipsychrobacter sp.]